MLHSVKKLSPPMMDEMEHHPSLAYIISCLLLGYYADNYMDCDIIDDT